MFPERRQGNTSWTIQTDAIYSPVHNTLAPSCVLRKGTQAGQETLNARSMKERKRTTVVDRSSSKNLSTESRLISEETNPQSKRRDSQSEVRMKPLCKVPQVPRYLKVSSNGILCKAAFPSQSRSRLREANDHRFQKKLNETNATKRKEVFSLKQTPSVQQWARSPEITAQKYRSANYSWHKQQVW